MGDRELTHLSLFAGIGGLDLAAEWAGIRTVGQCEWAEYPAKVLERHWPQVPKWKDIRTLTEESFYERTGRRTVDVISGGFPCQPFSVAGKQRGKEDDRYLWPEMARVVKELRPAWIVGENVAGIIRMALPDILSELEAYGYRTRAFLIPACAVGARHRRYRVAIVGRRAENLENPGGVRRGEPGDVCEQQGGAEPERSGETVADADNWSRDVRGNGELPGAEEAGGERGDFRAGEEEHESRQRRPAEPGMGGMADGLPGWVDGSLDFILDHYWDTEPDIPRLAAKVPHRADRIRALGNAVVPQQFYPVFKAIADIEREMEDVG